VRIPSNTGLVRYYKGQKKEGRQADSTRGSLVKHLMTSLLTTADIPEIVSTVFKALPSQMDTTPVIRLPETPDNEQCRSDWPNH